jgi:phosphoserine phosphatase RsbU/P
MSILLADDDPAVRKLVPRSLASLGQELHLAASGTRAVELWREHQPQLIITDWRMPGTDGQALCRLVRETLARNYTYVIMLTACDRRQDVIAGLQAGADDYVTKPFSCDELVMRVKAGLRLVGLQAALRAKITELEEALERVHTLEGLLPICAHCKQIRDAEGAWHPVEQYIQKRTGATLSHGVCPECMAEHWLPQLEALRRQERSSAE